MERAKEKATEKAIEKATENVTVQPQAPPRNTTGRLCRENRPLLSWFEEAMKEKPKPIEEALSTGKGQGGYYGRKGDMREQQQWRYEGRYEEPHQRTHGGDQAGHKATKEGQQQTTVQQEDGQWQTAMPRWKKRIPVVRKVRQFFSTEVEKAYNKMFKAGKCLRCFASDHKRAQCREPLKCLKCFKSGHVAGRCVQTIKPQVVKPKITPSPTEYTQPNRTYAQAASKNLPMGDLFLDERPDEEDVFMPPHTTLHPVCAYLERAAYINISGEATNMSLSEDIQRTLMATHGGTAALYRIMMEEGKPFLLICRDAMLRDAVVQEGPYDIPRLGVQFKLVAWAPTLGMAFQPPTHQTWIRLHKLPFQFWNQDALTAVTARLGTIKETMPYGLGANQFDNISLLIASQHPRTIPKNLRVREGEYTKRVRVQVTGSRAQQPGYFAPPPNPPQRRQHWERQQTRHHPYQGAPRRTSPTSGDSSEASNRVPGNQYWRRAGSVRKVWVKKPVWKPVQKPVQRPGQKPVQEGKIWKPKATPMAIVERDTPKVTKIQAVVRIRGDTVHVSLSNGISCQVIFPLQNMRVGISPFNIKWPIITPISKLPATIEKRFKKITGWDGEPFTINDNSLGNTKDLTVTCAQQVQVQPKLVIEEGNGTVLTFAGAREFTGLRLAPSNGPLVVYNQTGVKGPIEEEFQSPALGFESPSRVTEMNSIEFQGPPPGFATPQRVIETQIRRSPRLKDKRDGPYVTMLDRARAVQGYDEIKSKQRKEVSVKPQKPKPDYLASMEPLSKSQAEAVVYTAGIECSNELQQKIEAVLHNSGANANKARALADPEPVLAGAEREVPADADRVLSDSGDRVQPDSSDRVPAGSERVQPDSSVRVPTDSERVQFDSGI